MRTTRCQTESANSKGPPPRATTSCHPWPLCWHPWRARGRPHAERKFRGWSWTPIFGTCAMLDLLFQWRKCPAYSSILRLALLFWPHPHCGFHWENQPCSLCACVLRTKTRDLTGPVSLFRSQSVPSFTSKVEAEALQRLDLQARCVSPVQM